MMMKHLFPLLLALILCGCAPRNPLPEAQSSGQIQSQSAPSRAVTYPVSTLEAESGGALRVFPLGSDHIRKLLCVGGRPLLLLETDSGFRLEQFPREAGNAISAPGLRGDSLRALEKGVSYFDDNTRQTVVLDDQLRELERMDAPGDLMGAAVLSADRGTLYYCTPTAIRRLDLNSGISRVIKESAFPFQRVSGLLLEDSVVQITVSDAIGQDRTLFLSAENGQLLQELPGSPGILTSGDRFCAALAGATGQLFLCGSAGEVPQALLPPRSTGSCLFPDNASAALTLSYPSEGQTTLDYFRLDTGLRTASVTISQQLGAAECVTEAGGSLWFAAYSPEYDCQALYQWNPALSAVTDETLCTADYHTRKNPDTAGLAECARLAEQLSQKYGIEILISRDAAAVQPPEYTLEYEYQVPLLQAELAILDTGLGNLPEGFLQTLAQTFTGLKICIVGSITGHSGNGPDTASGIHFWDGYDAYIVLAAGSNTQYALYHQLCHLVETMVLTHSTAYDRWESMNPENFAYDNDYARNGVRNGSAWLEPGNECFIDTYAMSFPKEDRARIFEYAMTEGNAHRFAAPTMQAKLGQLCLGIREAFGLTEGEFPLPWEQYLTALPEY